MDDILLFGASMPGSVVQSLFVASNTSTLDKALGDLIEIARTADGRRDLSSKDVLSSVLQLCQHLSYPSCHHILLLSFKLLRNLCAGESRNQNSFIEQKGVEIVSAILISDGIVTDSDYGIIRIGLQVLANVSLAGKEHQLAVSHHVFSLKFVEIARLRSRDTCDPLCMIIYTCLDGNCELMEKLGSDCVLPILVEIIRTASAVGFGEDWLKLLLSRACVEESYFTSIFSKLRSAPAENSDDSLPKVSIFTEDQLFLLSILSQILNEQIEHIAVSKVFASEIFQLLKSALGVVNTVSRAKSGLPTGSTDIDALGYNLSILRDICACDSLGGFMEGSVDIVDSLLSFGLLEILLDLLHDLEPPALIRKAMRQGENSDGTTYLAKLCPYKGFRSDIVAVIGNCTYRRKFAQDKITEMNGILLMLQQCVTDEENPFLREWGIWAVRNLLEGNVENQRLVSELEVQGPVYLPELAGLGLRVEVDQQTRRAKLVNAS